jgi:hypothetical protein
MRVFQERVMGDDLRLTPPDGNGSRFADFRDLVERAYRWRWKRPCPWSGAEANQLSRLLKCSPTLDVREFAHWLKNYFVSEDYPPGERPSRFLPRIHNYSVDAVDRFSRPAHNGNGKRPPDMVNALDIKKKQLAEARSRGEID